eukprot:g3945.t1
MRERRSISSRPPTLASSSVDSPSQQHGHLPDDISSAVDTAYCAERLDENDDSAARVVGTVSTASAAAVVGKHDAFGSAAVVQEDIAATDAAAVEEGDASAAAVVAPQQHEPRQQPELITPCRIVELVEVCRTTQENFRELIRFLGRTLSDPACVSASFALRQPEREISTGVENRADAAEEEAGNEQEQSPPEDTAASVSDGITISEKNPAEAPEDPTASCQSDAARTTATTCADQATRSTSFPEEALLPNACSGDRYEWRDRSPVGMDVTAAAEVWKLLVGQDVEGVTNAVLNALDSLTQTLLIRSFLEREVVGDGASTAAVSPASGGAALKGAGGGSGSGGAERQHRDTKAELRAMLLVLEHPEVQDPDFEAVLNTLFKLARRLSRERTDELCGFLEGVEEGRFTRYLGAVQQFVALRLYSGGDSSSVLPAVNFVHLLYVANQKSRKVADSAFYNEAINTELFSHRPTLIECYTRWIQDHHRSNPAEFKSLISFGEVLDPATKAAILSLDSQIQMRGTVNSELQEAILFGGLGDVGLSAVSPYLKLNVRRSHIVADSLVALVMLPEDDLKKPLRVTFVGEEGIDEGGVQKEYFQVMMRELLDPKYAMLKYDEETRRLWFNSDSLESSQEFELVGMLLGIAIYNGIILDVPFPPVVYKLVMGKAPTLEDLKEAQPEVGRGLQQLLDFDGDVEATLATTFQISYEVFGAVKTFDLKEGGGETAVTRDNRQEYVDLYVRWLLVDSVKDQYGPFERGFHKVVGGKALKLFRPEELELLVCGNPKLDFAALEEHSKYEDGYSRGDPVVKRFWEVVHEFGEASKRKLLKFATGSDRAPIQGLGSSALSLVISKNGGDSDRLPTAHTCFNHLLLPSYSTKAKLKDRLDLAIEQSEGFGLR